MHSELRIIDGYLGPEIFDLIEDTDPTLEARLLASDETPKLLALHMKRCKNNYDLSVELRVTGKGPTSSVQPVQGEMGERQASSLTSCGSLQISKISLTQAQIHVN